MSHVNKLIVHTCFELDEKIHEDVFNEIVNNNDNIDHIVIDKFVIKSFGINPDGVAVVSVVPKGEMKIARRKL